MVLPFVWGAGMDTRPKKLSSHQPDLVLENYAYIQGVTVWPGQPGSAWSSGHMGHMVGQGSVCCSLTARYSGVVKELQ